MDKVLVSEKDSITFTHIITLVIVQKLTQMSSKLTIKLSSLIMV